MSIISSARTRSMLSYGSSERGSSGIVRSTWRAFITSRIFGIRSSSPRRNVVNHAVWFTPAHSKVTSSYGTSSSRARSSEVPCTLWHSPTIFTPSRSVAQTLTAIGFA